MIVDLDVPMNEQQQQQQNDDDNVYYAYKPLAYHNVIRHSLLTSNLLTDDDNNDYLIFGKDTLLELSYCQTENGVVVSIFEQEMFGKINDLKLLRGNSVTVSLTDLVVLLGNHQTLCLLELDVDKRFFVTKYETIIHNDLSLRRNRAMKLAVESSGKAIAVSCIENNILIYPVNTDRSLGEPINLEVDGVIWNIEFLQTQNDELYLAVIVNNTRENVIRIFHTNTATKTSSQDITLNIAEMTNIRQTPEALTQYIFPIPSQDNSFLAVHGSDLVLFNCNTPQSPTLICKATYQENMITRSVLVTSYCWIREENSNKLLLATEEGKIYFCVVGNNSIDVRPISNIHLKTSINTIQSLLYEEGTKLILCSGQMTNTAMFELTEDADTMTAEKISEKPNICPVVDFDLYYTNYFVSDNSRENGDIVEAKDERKTITCTATKEKGVGVQAVSLSEETFSGINGVWTLKRNPTDWAHSIVVLGFLSATRVLQVTDEGFEDISAICGFDINKRTIHCSCIGQSLFIQVTQDTIRVIQFNETPIVVSEWRSDNGPISVCSVCHNIIVIGMAQQNELAKLSIDTATHSLSVSSRTHLTSSISSIEICLDGPQKICFIGTYKNSVEVWDLEKLTFIGSINLLEYLNDSMAITESIIMHKLDSATDSALFIGLREGTLLIINLQISDHSISGTKILQRKLGVLPVSLTKTDHNSLVASSNSTYIIKYDQIQSQYSISITSLNRVLFIAPFNSGDSPSDESLITITESYEIDLVIMDYSQSLNIKTMKNEESCRRVLLLPDESLALTLSDNQSNGASMQSLDLVTCQMTLLHDFFSEKPFALSEWKWSQEAEAEPSKMQRYILVGTEVISRSSFLPTTQAYNAEANNPRGRLSLFELYQPDSKQSPLECDLITTLELPAGKRIVLLTFNGKFQILSQNMCRHFVHSISSAENGCIAVSDRYDSVSIFKFNTTAKTLDFVENERVSRSCASICMLSNKLIAGVERDGGFFITEYQESTSDTEAVLRTRAYFNLGETALSIKPLTQRASSNDRNLTCVTLPGTIINLTRLSNFDYRLLSALESYIWTVSTTTTSGGRSHLLNKNDKNAIQLYRSKTTASRLPNVPVTHQRMNVVDAEFITSMWKSLTEETQQQIIQHLTSTVGFQDLSLHSINKLLLGSIQ